MGKPLIFNKTKLTFMTKTLLIIVLSISVFQSFGQQDSLLKKFKYRIDLYRAIYFNVGGGTQFNKSEIPFAGTKNSSAAGGLGGYYYLLKSTDKMLLSLSANLTTSFYTGHSDNTNNNYKSRIFNTLPAINILKKWFSKKIFTELGTDASLYYYTGKDDASNYLNPSKYRRADYSIAVNTGIGTGRLENITDMQNTLWLYKELAAEKTLSRSLTAEEQNDLGRAITKGNNTRVLDGRKRNKFILKTVDNYLQQKGLISKNDINYFSSLNDILFFAFNSPRFSGTEKYIRFTPGIGRYSTNQSQPNDNTKFEHRFNNKSLVLSTGINKYTPQNLIHQNNYGASFKLSCYNFDITDREFTSGAITTNTKANSNLKQAAVNLFYEHAIYPNTRTSINFNLQTQGGYQDLEKETNFFGSVNFTTSLNYFISYRTRLTADLGAAYQKNVYTMQQSFNLFPDNLHLYANAGVNISL